MKNLLFLTLFIFITAGCSPTKQSTNQTLKNDSTDSKIIKLKKAMKSVESFFTPMGEPKPDEWLANFKETGQTFDQYISGNPTLPTKERQTIYIQPIGKFSEVQRKVIGLTAEYMESFFGMPVKLLEEMQLDKNLSAQDYRIQQQWKLKQIRSGYFLEKILPQILPKDAAALIAFTSEDLYPDASMNFVFGQASLENRVGVWSLYRLNDEKKFKLFLTRTFKIATHETGHMFSMLHCTKYECEMSGTNHLLETDSRPLDACPECMAKICWMTDYEPQKRYERLADFCRKNDLTEEAETFNAKAQAVQKALLSN
jgi:archaemetzincin